MSDKYDNNTQTHTLNVEYLLLHNWLIPSDLVKRFMATRTKTEKLCTDLPVIKICLAKLYKRLKKFMSKGIFLCFSVMFICKREKGAY